MHLEIEHKFLVKGEQWKSEVQEGKAYTQGYLLTEEQRTARVRMAGSKAYITIKGKTDEQTRMEFEYEIPAKDALILLHSLCLQPLIYKTRYLIPQEELCWEIDVFHKENKGLITAEIELGYPGQPFFKPEWIGEEVTDDPRYYNANLVSNPYQNW